MAKTEDRPVTPDDKYAREEREAYLEFRAGRHNRRLARDVSGMTLTGLRLHNVGDPEVGMVVTLTPAEAARVVSVVGDVLSARLDIPAIDA